MIGYYAGYADQEELDRAYAVERSVPDFDDYVRWYLEGSAAARSALPCRIGVPYGPTLMERANIFPATASEPAPIMVFIHGGYWHSLTADVFDLIAPGPVAAGFAVVNVTYALCPTVTISEIVRQIRAAIAWTARNAASFGGDPARIYVVGHSAGGHLTATSVLTDWVGEYGLPGDIIKGAIPISGLFELEPISYCYLQPLLRLTGEQVLKDSPIRHVRQSDVPLIVAWGGQEPAAFSGQSQNFLSAWQAAGNSGRALTLDKNHFNILDGFGAKDGPLTQALLSLTQG
jgi:arylformamidase